MEVWERLQRLSPTGASIAAGGLADLAAYQGRFDEAATLLQADLEGQAPVQPAVKRAALAMARLELGETAAALRLAEEATEQSGRLGVAFESAQSFVGHESSLTPPRRIAWRRMAAGPAVP